MQSVKQEAAISTAAALPRANAGDIPSYMLAAQSAAQGRGSQWTPLDVLADDRRRMLESAYPSPDCLQPEEIEALVLSNQISSERLAHFDACPMCQEILAFAATEQSVTTAMATSTA